MLEGLTKDCSTVAKQIQTMSEFLEQCYVDWLDHVEKRRSEFCYLNHYNTQQLVILCQEIVSLCNNSKGTIGGSRIDPKVYPMLCAVKHNCTMEDLVKAVRTAFKTLAEQQKHNDGTSADEAENAVVTEVADSEESDMKDRLTFVEAMLEAAFSEELAKRALREIPASDIDEGTVIVLK